MAIKAMQKGERGVGSDRRKKEETGVLWSFLGLSGNKRVVEKKGGKGGFVLV